VQAELGAQAGRGGVDVGVEAAQVVVGPGPCVGRCTSGDAAAAAVPLPPRRDGAAPSATAAVWHSAL
jgi:hypothetical protein